MQTAFLLIAGIVALASGAPGSTRKDLDRAMDSFPKFLIEKVEQISSATSDTVMKIGEILKMVKSELEKADKQLEAAEVEVKNLKAKNSGLTNQLKAANGKIGDLEAQAAQAKKIIDDLKAALAKANGKIEGLQKEKNGLIAEIDALKTEKENLEKEIAAKDKKIGELSKEIADQKVTIASRDEKIKELNKEIADQKENISSKDKMIGDLKTENESLNSLIQRTIAAKDKEIKDLEKKLANCKTVRIPQGYELVGKHYVKHFSQKKKWAEAQAACQEDGAQLITVEDDETIEWIRKIYRPVWTGANDIAQEGLWVWADSTAVDWRNIPWGPGEPNSGGGLLNEDCGLANYVNLLLMPHPGKIADIACGTMRFGYACEIPE